MNGPDPSDPATRTVGDQPSTSWPSLTATHDANGTPVANPATTLHPDGGPTAWRPGVTAGRYQVLASHKTGGLGQVWVAYDTAVGRTVALKTIRPDRDRTANVVARFVREGQVTGQLEHPSIVPLYDLVPGAPNGDEPHYVMRFIHGRTLAEATAEYHKARTAGVTPRLDLRGLLDRFLGVCHAVAFAHSHGYLHRDLKGQNVVLGDFHEVFVVDWGLAKRLGDPEHIAGPDLLSPDSDPPTRPGTVVGTPAYMAPEVAAKQPATIASDVYGLGAVLYQILTDHPPTGATTPDEALSKLTSGAPIPPPRALNPTVPAALEAVCRKALARTPADRYPSATALADDVRRWLADEPVSAYREPWPTRAARWARRHRTGVTAAAVALLLTAVGSAVAAGLIWEEKERTATAKRKVEAAKREEEKARADAEKALGLSSNLADELTALVTANETGQAPTGSNLEARRQALRRAVAVAQALAATRPDNPDEWARMAKLLRFAGTQARLADDRATAEQSFTAALSLQQKLIDRSPADCDPRIESAYILHDLAMTASLFGRLTAAAEALDRATAVLAELEPACGGRSDAQRAGGLVALLRAEVDRRAGRLAPATQAAVQAVDLFAALASGSNRHFLDPVFHGQALTAKALALRESGRLDGNYAPALLAHADAIAALTWTVASDARPDARNNLLLSRLEAIHTRLQAGRPATDDGAELNRLVAGWRELAAADQKVSMYRRNLARALTARGRLGVGFPEPRLRSIAIQDLNEAKLLLEKLAFDALDRPTYRADLAYVWAGLADASDDPTARRRATYSAREAVKSSPDDVSLQRLPDEVGSVVGRRSNPSKP